MECILKLWHRVPRYKKNTSRRVPGNEIETRDHVPGKEIETQQQQEDLETYQHLPLGDSEIRLLVVEPGADESNIVKATLRTVSFAGDSMPIYNAVSYCWGSKYRPEKILLRCASGFWMEFRVSCNLHSLLQHLRRPDRPTTLWIDAICIDQENKKEKESQIGKMAQIYQKADEVSIWLGEDIRRNSAPLYRARETSEAIFKFIRQVAEHGKEMVRENYSSGWCEFICLVKMPWFSRRWVLQELAFAHNPMMYCGKEKIPWETLKSAVEVFTNHFDAVLNIAWPDPEWSDPDVISGPDYDFCEVEWANPLEVIPLAAFMENAFEENTQVPAFTLEALVASMAVFKTSDPRDVIYALLSLAKDCQVKPDYTANLFRIYADFVEKVISTSGSLDIICRRWAANEERDCEKELSPTSDDQELIRASSWMRQTDGSMFEYKGYWTSRRRRCNPDPLVGMPGKSLYAACADRKAEFHVGGLRKLLTSTYETRGMRLRRQNSARRRHIRLHGSPGGGRYQEGADTLPQSVQLFHTLYAKGVVIGIVSSGNQQSSFIRSVGASFVEDPTSATVPEKLWRTLVGDRALGGGSAPEWYGDACLRLLEEVDRDLDQIFLMNTQDSACGKYWPARLEYCPKDLLEFCKRVEAVVYNQTAFDGDAVDADQGKLFGIGSREIEAGDRVCILFGCSVPVILRPTEDVDGNECFRCLGESFVYNMMNGEALEGLTDDQVKEFAIV